MKHKLVPVVLVQNEEMWLPYTLESVAGQFDRMVIYDVGSTDRTRDIIDWFTAKEDTNTEFFIRKLPNCDPAVQGTFRNSMIAETASEFYLILDGDEIYPQRVFEEYKLLDLVQAIKNKRMVGWRTIYGVIRRQEVCSNLTQAYTELRTHHRVYHRDAYWKGTHPGEAAAIKQTVKNEVHDETAIVYHMHNALRSSKEAETHKRIARKQQRTYHPGTELRAMNLLEELPILKSRIEDFPVNPQLEELWEKSNGK
jgi:glycosyltransferase involved in cell wall biosynthesis